MDKLERKQGQGFRGAYALYEDDRTTPINIEVRSVEIKIVSVEKDKSILTILDAEIAKTGNIAAFTVEGTSTTTLIGTFKVQVSVDGLDVTDKIISLTPTIIEFSKTY
jgi:hypothetical protein